MFLGRCSLRACRESAFAAISDFLGSFNKQLHKYSYWGTSILPNFQKDYTFDNTAEDNGEKIPRKESFPRFCY